MPTIWISRTGIQNLLRAYTIILDDQNVGKVRRGETVDVDVSVGQHTVRVAIDRLWTSPTIDLQLADGEVAELLVRPEGSVPVGPANIISRRNDYIGLERTS